LPGDEVFTSEETWARIGESVPLPNEEAVYNLSVEDGHSYFVGEVGAWVHNTCPGDLGVPGPRFRPGRGVAERYVRPFGTTAAQRAAVQGMRCVACGASAPRMIPDHIDPLVVEHYRTGTINEARQLSVRAVQPHCPACSAQQGGYLSAFSSRMANLLGL
jgi:hypothetical protein